MSIRLRPVVVAVVAVVALALPSRALADGSIPTAAQLVQQATSALGMADQSGLLAGIPEPPDPSTMPAIPADPTGGSPSTTTPPTAPAGSEPTVPVMVADPPAGPSEDTLASSQTAVPNAVSAISPPVPTAPDTTTTAPSPTRSPAPQPSVDGGGMPASTQSTSPGAPPQPAPVDPPTGLAPAQPQATVTPSPAPPKPRPPTTNPTPPQTRPAGVLTPTTAPSDTQYQQGNIDSTNTKPDIPNGSTTTSSVTPSNVGPSEPLTPVWNWDSNWTDDSPGATSITPSSSPSEWGWNWDRSRGSETASPPDLGACQGCNISIPARVLSPGDESPLTQGMATMPTALADEIASIVQGAFTEVALPALPPMVSGTPRDPPAAEAGALIGASIPAVSTEPPAQAAAVQAADTTGVEPAPAASAAAPLSVTFAPPAAPAGGVPVQPLDPVPAPPVPPRAPQLPVIRLVLPPVPPASHARLAADRLTAGEPVDGTAAASTASVDPERLAAASAPSSQRSSRSRAGGRGFPVTVPQFPEQGSSLAGDAAGNGSGSHGGAVMGLLATFFFIAPGLTQWLRVGTERRSRLLRAGRHERPG